MHRSLMMAQRLLCGSRQLGLAGVLSVAFLAGCASTDSPTPVIDKSNGGSAAAKPVRPAGAAATASPAPGTSPTGQSATAAASGSPTQAAVKPSTRTMTVVPDPSSPPVVVVAKPVEPPGPASLWDRIRNGFAMPALDTPLVAEKERFYTQKPEYLQRMFARGGRYLYYIVDEVEKRGMPTELALLPFVESAMNPTALSSAQAAGLWQFIPSTGKQYNLSQDWWVDNRRDVVHSTRAALDYLQTIYTMHGDDWFLALASYNWGENAVARAVNRNRSLGKPTDYLSLSMPAETRSYVPKLIAIKNIIAHAQELGIELPPLPNKPYFVTLEKTGPIDLKLAAQFAGMTVEEFVALNPAHNRPVIAASKNNEIKLPADRLDAFMEAVEKHGLANKPFASWQPHTLAAGETLDSIAQRGGITVAELRRANSLNAETRPIAGTRIIAPSAPSASRKVGDDETRIERFEAPRVYEEFRRPAVYHVVGKHETLPSIAARYGVGTASLMTMNGLKTAAVRRGMSLMVRQPASQTLLTDERGAKQVVATAVDETVRPIKVSAPVDDPEPAVAPTARARGKAAHAASHASPAASRRGTAASNHVAPRGTAASAKAPARVSTKAPAPTPAPAAQKTVTTGKVAPPPSKPAPAAHKSANERRSPRT